MNVGPFTIESLIVHDVPRRLAHEEGGEEPLLSDVPSHLDTSLRNFFTERIKRSLARNHYEVERDPASTSPVPDRVTELIGAAAGDVDEVLVQTSQEMAEHLFQAKKERPSQPCANPNSSTFVAVA